MPTWKQTDEQRDTDNFYPILGGYYGNGSLVNEAARGYWWSTTARSDPIRYFLYYDGNDLSTYNDGLRNTGFYIRCVSEEKDVQDLTYMQDMTPSIAVSP